MMCGEPMPIDVADLVVAPYDGPFGRPCVSDAGSWFTPCYRSSSSFGRLRPGTSRTAGLGHNDVVSFCRPRTRLYQLTGREEAPATARFEPLQ